jgi:hypothetical protein
MTTMMMIALLMSLFAAAGSLVECRVSMRSCEFEGSLDFLCLQIRHGCDVGGASARTSN